jgi:hypothetical protein
MRFFSLLLPLVSVKMMAEVVSPEMTVSRCMKMSFRGSLQGIIFQLGECRSALVPRPARFKIASALDVMIQLIFIPAALAALRAILRRLV